MKRLTQITLAIVLLLTLLGTGRGANYYVDSGAAGGGDGSIATPWNTLAAAQAGITGDKSGSFIYLKGGSVFSEPFTMAAHGSNGNPLTIDMYGGGAKPIIRAAVPLSGASWTKTDGYTNIYEADLPAATYPGVTATWAFPGSGTTYGVVWYGTDGNYLWGRTLPGVCSSAVKTVTRTSGQSFLGQTPGGHMIVDEVTYHIDSVTDADNIVLVETIGTKTAKAYIFPVESLTNLDVNPGCCIWISDKIYIHAPASADPITNGDTYYASINLSLFNTADTGQTANDYLTVNSMNFMYGCCLGVESRPLGNASFSSGCNYNDCELNYATGGGFDLYGVGNTVTRGKTTKIKYSGFAAIHYTGVTPQSSGNKFVDCEFGTNTVGPNQQWGITNPRALEVSGVSASCLNTTFTNMTITGDTATGVYATGGNGITVDGLIVTGAISRQLVGIGSSSNVTIKKMIKTAAMNLGAGLYACNISTINGFIFSRNHIVTAAGTGGMLIDTPSGVFNINANKIIGGGDSTGIAFIGTPASTTSILNNTIGNWGTGVYWGLDAATFPITFKNNIGFTMSRILQTPATIVYVTSEYNCGYNLSGGWTYTGGFKSLAAWQALGKDTTPGSTCSFVADPKFVGAPNYALQVSSPCRWTGTPVGLTSDFLGNSLHTPPSMGAYEYGSNSGWWFGF